MQPTHAAPSSATDETHDAPFGFNGFDAEQQIDGDDNFRENRRARQPHPLRTQSRIEELIRADHRKNEFMAMLSHELRSPLGSIRNAIGVLRDRIDADAALRQRMHALIERQVRHMTLLITDLFDVSRIACGQLQLQREQIDACVVLSRAIETAEPDLRQRNQRLSTRWPESSIWLSADAERLEQVFVNLLTNASRYTDPGGEIALSVDVHDSHVVIRVRDSGIGLAPDALSHIFDLFIQADAAAPRSRSGLGIGLALVRTIVQLHGGSVIAESAGLGHGSEFTVRLPQNG